MPDFQGLLIVGVLTTAGTTAFAPLITGIIALTKGLGIGVEGNEPKWAAVIALVLVVLALVQVTVVDKTLPIGIQTFFIGFTSWYALTRLAMSVHDDISTSPRSLAVGLGAVLSTPMVFVLLVVTGVVG